MCSLKFKKINKGFTLVELMVAVAVFSIVMVVAMSALLNVIDANNKARAIKTAINNVSFALEGISKDMRVGSNYLCGDIGILSRKDLTGQNCDNSGTYIGYRSSRAQLVNGKYRFAFYRYNIDEKSIEECLEKTDTDICDTSGDFQPITSNEVDINDLKFYVLGANPGEKDTKQPRMIMTVMGEAGSKDKIKTNFDLQTGVSQRLREK